MFMSSNNNKNKDLWNLIHIYGNFMPLPLWDLFHISMSFMPYYTKLYKKVDKLCAKWRSNGKVWKRQMKWVNNLFYKLGTEKCRLRAWNSNSRKVPGKGPGYPAPSPQTRTCGTPASGSSVLILLTEPETNQAIPQLAHNFAALPAILDVVDDPGHRKGKFVHDRIQKLFPVYVTFVGSAAQPIPPQPLSMMMNITQRPIVATYTIVLIVATKLDTQHLILLF